MALYAVTTDMITKQGDQVWYPFECEYDYLLDLMDALNEGTLVSGWRLKVQRKGDYLYEQERDEIVIGKALIKQISRMNSARVIKPGEQAMSLDLAKD